MPIHYFSISATLDKYPYNSCIAFRYSYTEGVAIASALYVGVGAFIKQQLNYLLIASIGCRLKCVAKASTLRVNVSALIN